ncbi:MAG: HlyD family secretion protein [Sediminicola sp.]
MKAVQKKNNLNFVVKCLAILLVIVAVIVTIKYMVHSSFYEDTNDAKVESYINPVSARAGGYIQNVLFGEHQHVKKGDTLIILDNREYLAKSEIARATVMATKANLVVLNAGIHSARTATLVNENNIASAKANLWKQQLDMDRYKKLLYDEAVTQSDYENVKTQYEIAENNLKALENGLKTSYSKITELEARRDLLLADIKSSEANLRLAEINLSYTVITSPYNGYTGRKSILEGQQVQAGQALVSIVSENSKWIIANFKETQLEKMYVGQVAEIRVDAFPNRVLKGEISAIAAATGSEFSVVPTDNPTGNFVKIIKRLPVKINFLEGDIAQVKAGMNVKVSVKLDEKN